MGFRSGITFTACAAALPLLFLSAPHAAMAAPAAGSLIKLPDDRNPRTDADSAVYYYAADGKRYVFPGDKIYFSWYRDFSGVRTVDAAAMSSIPLGGNVIRKDIAPADRSEINRILFESIRYGLEHRAAWVEAESDGTITSMVSRVGVDPISHPDTAILAMLLAA